MELFSRKIDGLSATEDTVIKRNYMHKGVDLLRKGKDLSIEHIKRKKTRYLVHKKAIIR